MRIIINSQQFYRLNESFGRMRDEDSFANFIREQLKSIYNPKGKYGKAPNPDGNCETNDGVIDVFPHSEKDKWSILNRFDTNLKVKTKIKELYMSQNSDTTFNDVDFRNWISENKYDLFDENGKYTQSLIDLNMETIIKGNENEEYSVDVLKEKFPNVEIIRFCSGDIRDTKKGIDLLIKSGDKEYTVQVKPFQSVKSFISVDGDTFFEVKAYLDVNKYSSRNVNVFMFVSHQDQKYILFSNNKNKITQMRGNSIRFYEPPLYHNFTESELTTKVKRQYNKGLETSIFFDQPSETLKNLYFRKEQIEKLIKKELLKIKRDERKK